LNSSDEQDSRDCCDSYFLLRPRHKFLRSIAEVILCLRMKGHNFSVRRPMPLIGINPDLAVPGYYFDVDIKHGDKWDSVIISSDGKVVQ
jgi:hypothetical protein